MLGILSTIKGRLALASAVTAVLAFAAIGTTLFQLNRITSEFDLQARHVTPLVMAVGQMTQAGLDEGALLRELMLTGTLSSAQQAELKNAPALFSKALDHARAVAAGEAGPTSKLQGIAQVWKKVSSVRAGILKDVNNGRTPDAYGLLDQEGKSWAKLRGDLHGLQQYLEAGRLQGQSHIRDVLRSTGLWSTGLLLGMLVFGGGFLMLTILRTVKRVGTTLTMMRTVAVGEADLSQRLEVRGSDEMDQIAEGFNSFVERIQGVIVEVAQAATRVAAAAEQLSTMSQQMNSGAQRQRVEAEQVAAAVNEMSATAQEVARSMEQSNMLTGRTDESSRAAARQAGTAVDVMETLQGELARSGQAVGELNQGVEDIGGIVDLINQIAEQTNLLALNAAIEAARAGEQGRGFAVVAEEVRSLAAKTQDATGRIRDLIERVSQAAGSVVDTMGATQDSSQSAGGEVAAVAEALDGIASMVGEIAEQAVQVATAAEEQSAVSEEINRNVSGISDATEETVTALEQSTNAANEVARLAAGLQTLVGQFRGV